MFKMSNKKCCFSGTFDLLLKSLRKYKNEFLANALDLIFYNALTFKCYIAQVSKYFLGSLYISPVVTFDLALLSDVSHAVFQ